MQTESPQSLIDRLNRWLRESVTIKLASIGFLVLLLLIPSSWVSQLMEERQHRADEVMAEVAQKWSGNQTISGPVLIIPFKRRERVEKENKQFEIREWTESTYFLPESLQIDGKIDPEKLRRGIFDAVVYKAALNLKAQFAAPDFVALGIDPADVVWTEAHLITGITDLRGISDNPTMTSGDKTLAGEPSNNLGVQFANNIARPANTYDDNVQVRRQSTGIISKLAWQSAADFQTDVSMSLPLKGSSQLYFSPLGKSTSVKISSTWANPSFDGDFLPIDRKVTEAGFTADWKVLHYNRPFSQQWLTDNEPLDGYDFGVRLLIPVDQYQKSIRTAKYGVLLILLTFISLFMVEIMKGVRIHPFQYILIGAALVIYYSLLLSFSEHLGYNWAYLVSSVATVVLVGLYATTFLSSRAVNGLFTGVLAFFYGFIFVIIQLQDYSLLLGSIGLFLIVAILMYASRRVRWYNDSVH